MSKEFERLFSLIEHELKSGVEEEQVVNKLMKCGLGRNKARDLVEGVKNLKTRSRQILYKDLFTLFIFLIITSLVSVGIFYVLYSLFNIQNINKLTWITLAVFLGFFSLSIWLDKFSGKIFCRFRIVFSLIAFLFSVFLTCLLFLHDDWGEGPGLRGGGWGALKLIFFIEGFYFIGSTGFFYIMVAVSFFLLLVAWNNIYVYTLGNFDALSTKKDQD